MTQTLYLDHAATTPPLAEALEAFERTVREAFANPGSLHMAGAVAARALEKARRDLRAAFGAERYRVVWTGTGTESNHLGIQGMARQRRKAIERSGARPRVLYGAGEHPSARKPAEALADEGFVTEPIPLDPCGIVRPAALRALLGPDVAMVTVQWANNELGCLQPVRELVELTRSLAPHAAFHVDAVQGAGKRPEGLDSLDADAIAVAAHKIGGVRGCAALLLRESCTPPRPIFVGGGHEFGLRSGTENVAGAVAFAVAAKLRRAQLDADSRCLLDRRAWLAEALRKEVPELQILGPEDEADIQGAILTVCIPGCLAQPVLHHLEMEGVLAGSGSACSSHSQSGSAVLEAIGWPVQHRSSVLRFSLCGTETPDDLERASTALRNALSSLVPTS